MAHNHFIDHAVASIADSTTAIGLLLSRHGGQMEPNTVNDVDNAYDAFLSYSHEHDVGFARVLQRRTAR